MDSLDEQLAQLKIINSRSLSPKLSSSEPPKKVGPAIPPKPLKKNNIPQVPQSSAVKQICEPLYSTRLQADGDTQQQSQQITGGGGTTIERPQRKMMSQQPIYSNMKMTLDNAAILDAQLEALEHHKKQLERKGLLPAPGGGGSFVNGGGSSVGGRYTPGPEQLPAKSTSHVYSNVAPLPASRQDKEPDVVYSNIMHNSSNGPQRGTSDLVYSNVTFGTADDELPPPPTDIPAPLDLTENSFEYLHQTSEDELPPPPSPVSSSYSELRRATDNFPQMPTYPMPTTYNSVDNSMHMNSNHGSHPGSSAGQRTYANTSYQNDYSTYVPSSQSISQNSSSDYYGYGSLSQSSSTYESIYEPINPRPPSQLSSRSNYSLYTSYVNGPQSGGSTTPVGNGSGSIGSTGNKLPSHKEAEVEVLTDLLVQSMNGGQDVDSYGICVKCGERVVGENNGCTAMEQVYHIACFTCTQCQINLQGKPFYALEGKPYCEEDYLNTLEKCSVCMKPILERILRATGKPYHPQCFCCVVCGNSLDGIPFTVDATNQNYCIEDFHKKFAPRCCVCRQPIMPEPGQEETVRVVALDRSFHFECYKCEDCGLLLSSEAEGRGCYPLDDHVLCKSCNAKRVQALTSRMTTEL